MKRRRPEVLSFVGYNRGLLDLPKVVIVYEVTSQPNVFDKRDGW